MKKRTVIRLSQQRSYLIHCQSTIGPGRAAEIIRLEQRIMRAVIRKFFRTMRRHHHLIAQHLEAAACDCCFQMLTHPKEWVLTDTGRSLMTVIKDGWWQDTAELCKVVRKWPS